MMPIIRALHGTEKEGVFPDPFHEATVAPPPKEGDNSKEIKINFFSEHRCTTFQQNEILCTSKMKSDCTSKDHLP